MRLARIFSPSENARIPLDAIALLLILNVAVGTAGWLYTRSYATAVRRQHFEQLEAVATLKQSQISSWRSERLQDAWAFFENSIVSRAVVDFILRPGDTARRATLTPLLEAIVRRDEYHTITVVGADGSPLLSFPGSADALPPRAMSIVKELESGVAPAFSDPFLDSDGRVRVLVVSPILDALTNIAVGAVAIEVDPAVSLYPMIAGWPIPSPTAEALIVRELDGRVQYLSQLRHKKYTVLLSIDATENDSLVSYKAIHGLQGPTEGMDYRGVPVYATIRKIGGLPWFLVVKIDKEEVSAEARSVSRLALAAAIVFMLLMSAWVLIRWSQQSARSTAERERLRTRLLKARELESVALLAAGVAHDFNNILAGISGSAEVLKLKIAEGSLREQAQHILEATKRGGYVVHGLLAFSDQQRTTSEPIDLNRLLLAEREEMQRSLGPSVALHLELSPAELRISGDPEQLCTVIRHLAENSKDAMPNGGSFTIQTGARKLDGEFADADGQKVRGPFACFTVSDTGIGMNEETQKRLFEPFFTTKQFGTSAGIGLAAIYGIVRQHSGFIDVRSAPGEGATFTILIPLADSPVRD
jgi:signal transduction histidine kinase